MEQTTAIKINHYNVQPAEQINGAISQLPKAELVEIMPKEFIAETDKLAQFKGVRVRDAQGNVEYVQVCGKDYTPVQHADAFRPIIEGITLAGNNKFSFSINANHRTAQLRVYTGGFGYDGVMIGWQVNNSFTGHSTLNYGVSIDTQHKYIEVVGYRQVCSNGMKVRVPIDQAQIIKLEEVTKIKTLLADSQAFKHTANVLQRVESVQYIAEAIELLRQPIENMIKLGQHIVFDSAGIKRIIMQHVGKRYYRKVREQVKTSYDSDNGDIADLWELYNAVTYVASHDADLSDSARELLQDKAANMLLAEIKE